LAETFYFTWIKMLVTPSNVYHGHDISEKTTMSALIKLALSQNDNKIALVYKDEMVTYAELSDRVKRACGFFQANHLQAGDRVAQIMPDSIDSVVLRLACHLTGIEVALIQDTLPPETLVHLIALTDPKVVITSNQTEHPGVKTILTFNSTDYTLPRHGYPDPTPDSPASINFSSGSTGSPKGIRLTQANWAASCKAFVQAAGAKINRQLTYLSWIPLAVAGSTSLIPSLLGGMRIIIPESRDPESILKLIQDQTVDFIFLTPLWLSRLIQSIQRQSIPVPPLQKIAVGTDTVHAEILERAINLFGPVVSTGYGMAEVLPPLTVLSPNDYMLNPVNASLLNSVGRPYPHVQFSLLDDSGEPVPQGSTGRIAIASSSRAQGYIGGNADDDIKFRDDGSFLSSDYGQLDARGNLYIKGREDQRLKTQKGWIFSRDIESLCLKYGAVQSACAVIDNNRVSIALKVSDSTRFALPNIKADLKTIFPQSSVSLVDQMPQTPAGKIDRNRVTDFFA
jgi:acyl-CoA synthetase (AMP-forming)/AMP-acid ligase II